MRNTQEISKFVGDFLREWIMAWSKLELCGMGNDERNISDPGRFYKSLERGFSKALEGSYRVLELSVIPKNHYIYIDRFFMAVFSGKQF